MSILLWVLAALGLGVMAVLVLPVRLVLRAQSSPGRLRLGLGLLGGLVPLIGLVDSDRPAAAQKPARRDPARRGQIDRARVARLLRAAPRFLGAVLGRIRVEQCRGACRFGFDDPAETGQVYGYLVPLTLGLRDRLRLEPDFTGARLEADLDCTLSVAPVRLLGPLMRLGWAGFGPRRLARP